MSLPNSIEYKIRTDSGAFLTVARCIRNDMIEYMLNSPHWCYFDGTANNMNLAILAFHRYPIDYSNFHEFVSFDCCIYVWQPFIEICGEINSDEVEFSDKKKLRFKSTQMLWIFVAKTNTTNFLASPAYNFHFRTMTKMYQF